MAPERLSDPTVDVGLRVAAIDLVARTRAAQGLPKVVADPAALSRLAAILGPQTPTTTARRSGKRITTEKAVTGVELPRDGREDRRVSVAPG